MVAHCARGAIVDDEHHLTVWIANRPANYDAGR
jgi:hypothetical protein